MREQLVGVIPRIPNDRETLKSINELPLPTLLLHYASWASRYVTPRPRDVSIENEVLSDRRWPGLKSAAEIFIEKVRQGADLTAHLSLAPHTRGYAPSATAEGNRWADKDFLLNVMGYHHFHLGVEHEKRGHVARTDELLFAKVTKTKLDVIAIMDHTVFDEMDAINHTLSPERARLWEIFERHASVGMPPGTVYMSPPIATSGHPLHIVRLAQEYVRIISGIDKKLDNRSYVQEMFESSGLQCPVKTKLSWRFNLMDLGIMDDVSESFFVVQYGFN